ncbi:MAG: hypothetical protein AMXMBFR57_15610 [Acidimicrobiia bacterium]
MTNDDVARRLAALGEPEVPTALRAAVMARAAQQAEVHRSRQSTRTAESRAIWLSPAGALGLAAGAFIAWARVTPAVSPALPEAFLALPGGVVSAGMVASAVLFLVGLFAPLRTHAFGGADSAPGGSRNGSIGMGA